MANRQASRSGLLGTLYVAAALAPARSFRVVVPAATQNFTVTELNITVSEDECGCQNARLRSLSLDGQQRETTTTPQILLEK